jgi:enamine deaminase RidA (YjgF/YER057c/UK114 family)
MHTRLQILFHFRREAAMEHPDFASAHTHSTPEKRLTAEGIDLPSAPGPLGAYRPWVIFGSLLITSGQFPWRDGKLAYVGRIGSNVSPKDAYAACRLAAINAIAQLKDALGDLTRIKQIVRVEGTMQVATGFRDHPKALDGASDLINIVFGEAGRHSRMIYTNTEMPLDTPVLLVLLAEIRE